LVCKNQEEEKEGYNNNKNTMKMKTTKIILLAMLMSFGLNTIAQVAINNDGSAPNGSAMLDVKSISKGLLLPRLSTIQISGISNPAAGLMVFNIDSSDFYGFNGSKWISMWNIGDTLADWYCGNTIFDARDGKTYATVLIGNQCWFAENLSIGTRIDGANNQTDNSTIEKYCYSDDDANCTTYGGLYQWDEMMQYVTTDGAQGICPDGWHLSTDTEWTTLIDYLGGPSVAGEKMKSISGWYNNGNGTNISGFTGLPGGRRYSTGSFSNLGNSGFWWSSTEGSGSSAWRRSLFYDSGQVGRYGNGKAGGFSVRCLKN